jgi:hypothetical protein
LWGEEQRKEEKRDESGGKIYTDAKTVEASVVGSIVDQAAMTLIRAEKERAGETVRGEEGRGKGGREAREGGVEATDAGWTWC